MSILKKFFLMIGLVVCSMSANAQADNWRSMMKNPDANFFDTRKAFYKYWEKKKKLIGDKEFKDETDAEGSDYNIFRRWEYRNRFRVMPDGFLPPPDHAKNQYFRFAARSSSSNGNWKLVGPVTIPANTSYGVAGMGRVNAIAFHPTDPNTIFVGTPAGGIWKTTDGGTTWDNLSDDLPVLGVSAILINPTNPEIILIGTGDRDGNDSPGYGVFKTTDGGLNWIISNTGMGNQTVGAMIFNPNNQDMVLAATSAGVYLSNDFGDTWLFTSTKNSTYDDIVCHPAHPDTVYTTTGGSFYRSMNFGQTWTKIATGVSSATRAMIGVSPNQPDWVYLLVATSSRWHPSYIVRSVNAGSSFTTQANSPSLINYSCTGGLSGNEQAPGYDLVIVVDPGNANTLYTGAINIWKSVNAGVNWSLNTQWASGCGSSIPILHADYHAMEFSPLTGNLYAGNDGGIHYTNDGGVSWQDISDGLSISQINRVAQCVTDSGLVLLGLQDNGALIIRDTTFASVIGETDGMECLFDYSDTSYKYSEVYYGEVYRSVNNGSYDDIALTSNGISNADCQNGGWISPYILHRTNPNVMFLGLINVWRTTNVKTGNNADVRWQQISTGGTSTVIWLEQSPADTNILYAASWTEENGDVLMRSDNIMDSIPAWTNCTVFGSNIIQQVRAHPTDPNTVYAVAGYGVYKSTDKGLTWTNISGSLPAVAMNCLVYDSSSNEGLYVGSEVGIYYKDATMTDWVMYNGGLPIVGIPDLEIYYGSNPANNMLKAATFGRGLWESPTMSVVDTVVLSPDNFTAVAGGPTQVNLSWNQNANNNNVMIAWNTTGIFGTPVDGVSYPAGSALPGGGTVLGVFSPTTSSHSGLQNSTVYYYTAWSINGSNLYSIGVVTQDTTQCGLISSFPWYEGFEHQGQPPDCWSQVYDQGSNDWVYQTGGTGGLPATAHTGIFNACFYMSGQATTKLITPAFNLDSVGNPWLKYYHTQAPWNQNQDTLNVYYQNSPAGPWVLLSSFTGPIAAWQADSIALPNPSGSYSIAFQGIASWSHGVCVDDVSITAAPSVSTANVTAITGNTATGGGTINTDGGYAITASGVCWNTAGSPTLSDSFTTDGTTAGTYTSFLNGLDENTVYYIRAYATNLLGTTYGNQVSFTTNVVLRVTQFKTITLNLFPEGLYNPATGHLRKAMNGSEYKFPGDIADTIHVEIRKSTRPYEALAQIHSVNLDTNGFATFSYFSSYPRGVYLIVEHRNSIETWSAFPLNLSGESISYSFTDSPGQAYGENVKDDDGVFLIYGGDVNQDGFVNSADMDLTGIAARLFSTGYLAPDVNGDGIVDARDLMIIDNNAMNEIQKIRP